MWIAQHILSVTLNTSAMRQVARIRTKFLEAVLRQDIEWCDTLVTLLSHHKSNHNLSKHTSGTTRIQPLTLQAR